MGRRADPNLVAADQRDALLEVHELDRDLHLIVIHCLDCVEIAALCAQEHGVGRERPFAENAARLGAGDRGHDLGIVLMTEMPPSPAWGLSAATAMWGCGKPTSRMQRSVRISPFRTDCRVMRLATFDSGTCEVMRAFDR